MFDKGKALILKNEGPEVAHLSNEAKEYMNILFDISENVITSNFNKVRKIILSSNEKIDSNTSQEIKSYEFEIVAMFSMVSPRLSYGSCVAMAYNSIMHENYILFYLVVKYILMDINSLHRVFFDDVLMIKTSLQYMAEKLNRPISYPEADLSFDFFYEDCIQEYYPIGDCLRTKDDYVYLDKSKYDTENFSIKLISEDFKKYSQEKSLRFFVYELDNYLNKFGNQDSSSKIWGYLCNALTGYFLAQTFPWSPWSRHFSKCLLKAIIGYSKCFDHKRVADYTMKMKVFILELLKEIDIIAKPSLNFVCQDHNNMHFLEIVIFLINLYYVFPFSEIIDCCESILYGNMSLDVCNDSKCEYAYSNIVKHISRIKSNEKENDRVINLFTTSSETRITDVEIVEQSNCPKFTRVILGIDMVDSFNIDVQLKFYDKDGQQICNDMAYVLTFIEDDSEKNHYLYETTILEGSIIHQVEAQITRKFKKIVNTENTDGIIEKNDDSNLIENKQAAIGNDSDSIWWGILGYLLSFIGIVLWFIYKDTKPKMAKRICVGSIIAIIAIIISLIQYL